MAKEKSVQSLLMSPDHPLGSALQRANLLRLCNQRFQAILPKHLIDKVNIVNVRQHCVIIGVTNATLMTQLHFEAEKLLNEIKQLPGMQLSESIQFKVMPSASNQLNMNKLQTSSEKTSSQASVNTTKPQDLLLQIGKETTDMTSAKRATVSAYASRVLRQAASEVKDPLLKSVLLNLAKKSH